MRGAVKNYVFGQSWEPNTIIGGVGSVITTKSALATKLGISESIIKRFEVVGNDVHCIITDFYYIPVNCFSGDTSITSFIDIDGLAYNQVGNFRDSTIKYAELRRVGPNQLQANCFSGSELEHLVTPHITQFDSNALDDCSFLHTIDAPLATLALTQSVRNTPNLAYTNFKLKELGTGSFLNSSAVLDLSEVHTIQNSSLTNGNYPSLHMPLLTNVNTSISPWNSSYITSAKFDVLENIPNSNNMFLGWTNCDSIEMKKLKVYGAFAAGGGTPAQYGFSNLKMGCNIKVHEDLLTANAGAPHEAFLYAKNTRGATVEFYDDAGNYVSTL